MPQKDIENVNNRLALIVIGAFILTLIAGGLTLWQKRQASKAETEVEPATVPIESPTIIEYNGNDKNDGSKELTEQRKTDLGVDKGLDLIVKADESVKIGDTVVPMKEILERIKLKRGDILESDLKQNGTTDVMLPSNESAKDAYGIYIVRSGDNIWNVHFQFLKDFFAKRGVSLSPTSDEMASNGRSSGIGKILKFSENMVYIYNLRDHRLDIDLDTIHPLTKIVVFDMGQVFALLDQISYDEVNRIQFDGETLWVPAKQ